MRPGATVGLGCDCTRTSQPRGRQFVGFAIFSSFLAIFFPSLPPSLPPAVPPALPPFLPSFLPSSLARNPPPASAGGGLRAGRIEEGEGGREGGILRGAGDGGPL